VDDEAVDAETEADLQHEHRAEALDALATIELKFALLRERVYVEKMEALAWEETLVENGEYLSSCASDMHGFLTTFI
jgi:Sds3-like